MRQTLEKISTLILRFIPAFLVLIVPLIFLPFTSDFFTINKQFLVYIVASLALIFFCIRLIIRNAIRLTISPSLIPFALLAIVYIFSVFFQQPNPGFFFFSSTAFVLASFLIFLSVTSSQKNETVVRSIILTSIITAVLLSLFALANNFGLLGQLGVPSWMKDKLFSPAGSSYHFLTFAVPVMLGAIAYGIVSKNWVVKPLVLAAVVIIAAASVFSTKNILPSGQSGMALLPYQAGWSIAVDTFKTARSALVGTGPDTYSQVFTRLKPAYLNQDNNLWSVNFSNSSSEFLTLLSTVGILGLLFAILTYFNSIKALVKEKIASDPETAYVLTGLVVFFLFEIFLPSSIPAYILGLVLIIAATVKLKLSSHARVHDVRFRLSANPVAKVGAETALKKTAPRSFPIAPWLLTILSLVGIAVFWTGAISLYRSQVAIFSAAQHVKDNPVQAYNEQVQAVQLDPTNPYLHLNLSQTYMSVVDSYLSKKNLTDDDKTKAGNFANQAVNEAKTAVNLNPFDAVVWENLAGITRTLAQYNVTGAQDLALSSYSQSIALDPSNPSLRVQLGTFYFNLGDTDSATRLLEQAASLKPDWNVPYYNLGLLYRTQKEYSKALTYMQQALDLTDSKSQDYKTINDAVTELKKLAPTPTPTPTSSQQQTTPTTAQ